MPRSHKFRVFEQDVGAHGYSGVRDVLASSPMRAVRLISKLGHLDGNQLIALPHTRKDLWPDGRTGRVRPEALKIGRSESAA